MKNILLPLALCVLTTIAGYSQSAYWVGTVSNDWNDEANWNWPTGGSGIPSASTDVVISSNNFGINYPIINTTASCKNIQFISNPQFYPSILLNDNSTLNIYGNINEAEDNYGDILGLNLSNDLPTINSTITFLGEGNQSVSNVQLMPSNVIINKPSGNVLLQSESYLMYYDTLKLLSLPAALGAESHGNIILDHGLVSLNPIDSTLVLPNYSNTEIPPHLIIDNALDLNDDDGYGILLTKMSLDFESSDGLQGTFSVPVGTSTKSFTPITISSEGNYGWVISLAKHLPEGCIDNDFNSNIAVQLQYDLLPVSLGDEGMPLTEIPDGTSISFTFNKANVEDVLPEFQYNDDLELLRLKEDNCYEAVDSTSLSEDGDYITISKPNQRLYSPFVIKSKVQVSVDEIIKKIGFNQYPNPAMDVLNISIANNHPTLSLRITDAFGREIKSETYAANALNTSKKIDITSFASGIYFLHLNGNNIDLSTKFVKQ